MALKSTLKVIPPFNEDFDIIFRDEQKSIKGANLLI